MRKARRFARSMRQHRELVEAIAARDGEWARSVMCAHIYAGRAALLRLRDELGPIYDDDRISEARAEVERRRVALLRPWIDEGWWTGLDIGSLASR